MIATRPELIAADAAENSAIEHYIRQRQVAGLLREALARAEARWRLETALQQPATRG